MASSRSALIVAIDAAYLRQLTQRLQMAFHKATEALYEQARGAE